MEAGVTDMKFSNNFVLKFSKISSISLKFPLIWTTPMKLMFHQRVQQLS